MQSLKVACHADFLDLVPALCVPGRRGSIIHNFRFADSSFVHLNWILMFYFYYVLVWLTSVAGVEVLPCTVGKLGR